MSSVNRSREYPDLWSCCMCNEFLNFQLFVACFSCEHKRCSRCPVKFRPPIRDNRSPKRVSGDASLPGPGSTSVTPEEGSQHVKGPSMDPVILLTPMQSPFKRPGRLLDLPILIENREHLAVPDTGTTINAISYAALSRLSSREVIALEDDSAKPESYKLGDGRKINAIGQIMLHCAFLETNGARAIQNVLFRVYDTLAMGVSVIIGKTFLDATETLTKHSTRLIERSSPLGRHIPRVMRVRPCKRYMCIYINSMKTYAYADTGSELNLVSLSYATRRGFKIDGICGAERLVAFADGKIRSLSGKICIRIDLLPPPDIRQLELENGPRDDAGVAEISVKLSYTRIAPEPPQLREFYVFDGLDCDVLLGQVLLDAIDAFNSYQHAFVQMSDEEQEQRMCGIFKVGKLHKLLKRYGDGKCYASSVPSSEDQLYDLIDRVDQCEIARRDKADAEITKCRDQYVRETDPKQKAKLAVRERKLIVANRDLCAQYEKKKADIRSAFQNASTRSA